MKTFSVFFIEKEPGNYRDFDIEVYNTGNSPTTDTTKQVLASLVWDEKTDKVGVTFNAQGLSEEQVFQFATLANGLRLIMGTFRNLCQGSCYDPSEAGLVYRSLPPDTRTNISELTERNQLLGSIATHFSKKVWHSQSAWFAPDADPTQFGTPYLKWGSSRSQLHGAWSLYQVGVQETPLRTVIWNKPEEITDMASQCFTDPELALVSRALEDSELVARSSAKYNLRRKVEIAREEFQKKSSQIKPRVVKKTVEETVRSFHQTGPLLQGRTLHDLRPTNLYGWRSSRGDTLVSLYAAYSFDFREATQPASKSITQAFSNTPAPSQSPPLHPTEEDKKQFLNALHTAVEEKKLGTLLVEKLRGNIIRGWIVKDTEKFLRNIEVFNATITDRSRMGTELIEYSP